MWPLGAAATGILESFVGTNYAFTLTSDTDGDGDVDLTMQFDSLSDALIQAMNSGIWGGIYMRSAAEDALDSGDQIGTLVMGTQFVAVPEPGGLLLLAVSSAHADVPSSPLSETGPANFGARSTFA